MAIKFKTRAPQNYSVTKASRYGHVRQTVNEDDEDHIEGYVESPHGIAICESNRYRIGSKGNYRWNTYTTISFVYEGKHHRLYDEKFYTQRSLSSLTSAFIKAIVNGERL